MSVQAVALLVSIGTAVFTAGLFFGNLRGRLNRTREHLRDHGKRIAQLEAQSRRAQIRARDTELALSVVAGRPITPRFPQDWPDVTERPVTYAPGPGPHPAPPERIPD